MFQFRRFPTYTYLIQCTLTEYCSAGFPHSEISGSTVICTSPKLIAACHVLHRLLMPRHSPCALISLTYFLSRKKVGKESFNLFCRFSRKKFSLIWFSEFELCRLQIQQNYCFTLFVCYANMPCFAVPLSSGSKTAFNPKSSTITFVSLCCLLFILWLLCSVFKVRF